MVYMGKGGLTGYGLHGYNLVSFLSVCFINRFALVHISTHAMYCCCTLVHHNDHVI